MKKVTKQNKRAAQWSGQSRRAPLTRSRSHLFIDDLPLRSSVQFVTDVLPSRIKSQCCNESLIHRFVLGIPDEFRSVFLLGLAIDRVTPSCRDQMDPIGC